MKVWATNGWNTLKSCILGDVYAPDYFQHLSAGKVKDTMQQVLEETKEDLHVIQNKLESFGITIHRPSVDNTFDGEYHSPPLQPRDTHLVFEDTLFYTGDSDNYNHIHKNIPHVIKPFSDVWEDCPSITRLDDNVILDGLDKDAYDYFEKYFTGKKITVHTLFNKGHSDGIYQPLGPGVWMSHGPVFRNKNVFADWQTVSVEENDWTKYHDFVNFKNKAKSKWAIPGQEYSDELINFVDTYIENWVGYCEETIFDLGFVMVSPIDALVISKNQKYEDTMYSYGITPHYVPWRHRTFWDCGLHCIITDLERDVLS
tara:strand:+ start:30944 stop:31885 length:942 start_codon:yes stop_codon:yes gene_type:complete